MNIQDLEKYIMRLISEAGEHYNNPEATVNADGIPLTHKESQHFYAGQLDVLVHLLRKITN